MCNAGLARVLLFVFNFIFWLAGAGVLGIGIWMKVDATIVNFLEVVNIDQSDPLIDHAAILFIVVGGFVFLVGLLGCLGALRGSQSLLFVYALLVLVVMVAELAAAILALIYKQKIENHLQESMQRQVREDYGTGTGAGAAWDFLQVSRKCCGVHNFTDYQNSNWWNSTRANRTTSYVPVTCCVLRNDDPQKPMPKDDGLCQADAMAQRRESAFLNTQGCYDALESWFRRQTLILMIVGFAVGGIQVFGFVTACCLRSALKKEHTFART